MQPAYLMRGIAVISAIGIVAALPLSATAQDRTAVRPPHLARGTPVVTVAPAISDADTDDDVNVAARHLADQLAERLQPLEQRLREDRRLRSAGAVLGLSAAAIGALRGQQTLTFVGTQALRLGLDRQLTALHARSGVVVEPTIGHRRFSITVSKTFDR